MRSCKRVKLEIELLMPQTATYREVVVRPMSSWREAAWVLGIIAIIALLVSVRILMLPEEESRLFMRSYHRLDTSLNDTERTIYQALLSAQNDLLLLWETKGEWPSVELLDEEGIPPFARDLMPGALQGYRWQAYNRGPWVDYLGVNMQEEDNMPSALLRIINLHADFHPHPHPGKDYDPDQKAAIQIWLHPADRQKYAGMQLAEFGWSWIVSPDDPSLTVPDKKKASDKLP